MSYDIVFAPEAIGDFKRLTARERTTVRTNIEKYLRITPTRTSRTRIKRLRGISHPQFRLRIDDIRVFFDVTEKRVEILAIVPKTKVADWLAEYGEI